MNNEIDKTMLIDTKGMPLQKIFDILHNNNIHNKEIHCKEMFIDLIDDEGETMLEIQYELERRKINYDFDDNGNIFLIKVG